MAARRYLVATDPGYRALLSGVSTATFTHQGGAMSPEAVETFRRHPDWKQAVSLRRIDDRAKVVGLAVPPLESYRERLLRVVAGASNEGVPGQLE